MTAQITWTVERMWVKPTDGDYTDVVITAAWNCRGVQDAYTAAVVNSTSFSQPGPEFIPYDQLTQDEVLGWIWSSGVDKAAAEATVQQLIDEQITPPIITPPLPWEAPQ